MELSMQNNREMPRSKIVHIINGSKIRGAELFALQLSEALQEYYPKQIVCAMACKKGMDPYLGTQMPLRLEGNSLSLRSISKVRQIYVKNTSMVVIAHGYEALKLAILAKYTVLPRHRPIIINKKIGESRHWMKGTLSALKLRLQSYLLSKASAIVALGPNQETELVDLLRVNRNSIVRIPNGRKLPSLNVARDRFPSPKEVRILVVGSLSAEKQPLTAIDILQRLVELGIDAKLTLIGSGPLLPDVKRYAHFRGLSGSVTLEGHVADPFKYYLDADLLLLCSQTEGFPGVVLEANSVRLPVVCWKVGDVAEAVINGENGFCTDYGDINAIVCSIVKLVSSHELYQEFSRKAEETAQNFTIERSAVLYRELIDRLELKA